MFRNNDGPLSPFCATGTVFRYHFIETSTGTMVRRQSCLTEGVLFTQSHSYSSSIPAIRMLSSRCSLAVVCSGALSARECVCIAWSERQLPWHRHGPGGERQRACGRVSSARHPHHQRRVYRVLHLWYHPDCGRLDPGTATVCALCELRARHACLLVASVDCVCLQFLRQTAMRGDGWPVLIAYVVLFVGRR